MRSILPSHTAVKQTDLVVQTNWLRWSRQKLKYVLLAFVLLLLYKVAALGYYGVTTWQSTRSILQLVVGTPSLADLPALQPHLTQLARGVAGLERHSRIFSPLLRAVNGLPVYGPTVAAIPNFLVVGRELTEIAAQGSTILSETTGQDAISLQAIIDAIVNNGEVFARLAERAEIAATAMNTIPIEQLHPALSKRLQEIQPLLPAMAGMLRLTPQLPSLLGMDAPSTWLVLVQNNHELRATGGFISAVGQLTIDNGQVSSLDFSDSYNIHDPSGERGDYPAAPIPMQKYMNIPILLFRDANWSPDLPTSARLAQALYLKDTGVSVDGIVTVDLHAAQLLIGAFDELWVEGVDQPITGENFVDQIKGFWEVPHNSEDTIAAGFEGKDWWEHRKDFMPLLAQAALARLKAGEVSYPKLAQAGISLLQQRSIQVWSQEKALADVLNSLGWDGSIQPMPNSDYLALVDTNMGYNKVDAVLQRQLSYQVIWPAKQAGPASATVTISYEHPLTTSVEEVCDQRPRYGGSYDEMTRRCYFNYVRVFAQSGSRLVSSTGLQAGSENQQRGEKGTMAFSGFFVLRPGERHVVSFTYELPAALTPTNYQLVVQRQSGISSLPLTLEMNGQSYQKELTDGRLVWSTRLLDKKD